MITQRYNLNLIPDKVPVQVNCSQYDSLSRTIEFTIYDGTVLFEIPSGSTVTVRGTKSDNTGFEYPCTFDGSVVSFDIQAQMTIFSGRVPCEIRFVNDGIIGTCNFNLYVEPTPLDTDVTISETDLPLLEEAEQNAIRAEQAADQAESLLSTVVKSVNNVLPDSDGNVSVNAVPSGGTTGQYLRKTSSGYAWETVTVDQTYSSSSTNAQSGVAVASAISTAKTEVVNELTVLVITSSSFSSLPQTLTNSSITADHVVVNSVLSNPSAQTGDWTVTTSSGSLSISGSISGSTTLTLYLAKGA